MSEEVAPSSEEMMAMIRADLEAGRGERWEEGFQRLLEALALHQEDNEGDDEEGDDE